MTRFQVKKFCLEVLSRWNKNTVWMVTYGLHDGTKAVKWFKHEKTAREWAALLLNPTVERIIYSASQIQKYGFTEDQIHIVQHSL